MVSIYTTTTPTFSWSEVTNASRYRKTANEWSKRDVAIIKGSVKMLEPGETVDGKKAGDSERLPSWIGPTGTGKTGLAIGFAWPAREKHLQSLLRQRRTGFAHRQ